MYEVVCQDSESILSPHCTKTELSLGLKPKNGQIMQIKHKSRRIPDLWQHLSNSPLLKPRDLTLSLCVSYHFPIHRRPPAKYVLSLFIFPAFQVLQNGCCLKPVLRSSTIINQTTVSSATFLLRTELGFSSYIPYPCESAPISPPSDNLPFNQTAIVLFFLNCLE